MISRIVILLLLVVLAPLGAEAQCAMCKAIAETSQAGGSSVADGLNTGIVYLMFFPYLLLGVVGFAIYRHRKSHRS